MEADFRRSRAQAPRRRFPQNAQYARSARCKAGTSPRPRSTMEPGAFGRNGAVLPSWAPAARAKARARRGMPGPSRHARAYRARHEGSVERPRDGRCPRRHARSVGPCGRVHIDAWRLRGGGGSGRGGSAGQNVSTHAAGALEGPGSDRAESSGTGAQSNSGRWTLSGPCECPQPHGATYTGPSSFSQQEGSSALVQVHESAQQSVRDGFQPKLGGKSASSSARTSTNRILSDRTGECAAPQSGKWT